MLSIFFMEDRMALQIPKLNNKKQYTIPEWKLLNMDIIPTLSPAAQGWISEAEVCFSREFFNNDDILSALGYRTFYNA